ncbi:hypothetical protein F5I97DRAFT_1861369 [Phlebopus sp. FC_14]|nr:hypothetical protein F5I97DRAFT_1861369 [Phlebopus sp. FC_14]
MRLLATSIVVLATFTSIVTAQFGFFDHMFGNPQQHQRQSPGSNPGNSQWSMQADSVACSSYLCPDSLVCVAQPFECPCPNVEDVKCTISDAQDRGTATVVCVRGKEQCATVERLARSYSE